jgi:hypothetical protein
MNFTVTKGTPNSSELAAIESALNSRKDKPVNKRSNWGKPQLRSELIKGRKNASGK